jgi:hypothetical protein
MQQTRKPGSVSLQLLRILYYSFEHKGRGANARIAAMLLALLIKTYGAVTQAVDS